MLAREAIQALIPHQGAMCLWDEVMAWDAASIRLRAHGHRDPAHPLRSDGRLRAVHLCEYGAQAMAVHGGLRADAPARQGLLVALREVRLHVARADDLPGALEGEADVLADAGHSQQYAFRIVHAGALLAEGRAAVMFRDGLAAPTDAG
ncbi:phosphotransferase [Luteimonas aquatica]|uniref:phosphotransferase n=1 Tax=Luteimonas aquatica TaxID=450364 RepID=UPI001F572F94|nr:phosphotransferase [Luteimonas aquatica]